MVGDVSMGVTPVRNSPGTDGNKAKELNKLRLIKAVHLYQLLLTDLSELAEVDLKLDLATIHGRVSHEGLPFLTRTLPKFGDDFFKSLNLGTFQPTHHAFAMKGALPKFLIGLTSRVFDAKSGAILTDPCYIAAFCIRQVCYLLYKMEVPYSAEQERDTLERVKECDLMLDGQVQISPYDKVLVLANSLINDVLGPFRWDDVAPRHGPGATSEVTKFPWEKYNFAMHGWDDLPDDLFFPPSLIELGYPSLLDDSDIESYALSGAADKMPELRQSRVSTVPKNSKGPRVISAEAVRLMYVQLGIDDMIRDRVHRHELTCTSIRFNDQGVNAKLALQGSRSGEWATLDLSEASDRNSMKLVGNTWPTEWVRAIERTRSVCTLYPDGEVRTLNKCAPMGNGYCFSVETLTFWALTVATIVTSMGEAYTNEDDILQIAKKVHVYGDDIIVPQKWAGQVMTSLERYGFRINRDKSFWAGPFRESCGTDAFRGVNITPLKIKAVPQVERSSKESAADASFVASWFDQGKRWSQTLPRVGTWMVDQVYWHIGFVPTYPEGWAGCIGEPLPYERLKGTSIPADTSTKSIYKQARVGADGLVLFIGRPPSAGKVVKVVRVKAPDVNSPSSFTDELAYTRWLEKAHLRPEVLEPLNARRFTLKYSQKVSINRVWVS